MLETSSPSLTSSTIESVPADRLIRVYLVTPSNRLAGPHGGVLPLAVRHRATAIRDALLSAGVSVYSPIHDDGWRAQGELTGSRVPSAFRAMHSADVVIAFVSTPLHAGVALELGWAASLRKPTVLLVDQAEVHKTLIGELDTITSVLPIRDDAAWGPEELRHAVLTMIDWGDMLLPPRN